MITMVRILQLAVLVFGGGIVPTSEAIQPLAQLAGCQT